MKLGTESKNKTIFAVVLLGLAVILLAHWLLTSDSGSSKAAIPKAPTVVTPDAPQDNTATAKSQSPRRSDQKTLTALWKPSLDPSLNLKMLESSENIKYEGTGRNIFEMTAEPAVNIPAAVAPARTGPQTTVAANPGPPAPPPINLKFYGYSTTNGQKTIFLTQGGDSVFVAHEGDIIARRYKVVRINPNSVEIQDMLTNNKQTIALIG